MNQAHPTTPKAVDARGRPLRDLRVSVTDRCNLRCRYCMPAAEYAWLPRVDILDFAEISQLINVFSSVGVRKVRITGGEPLLRKELPQLVSMISTKPAIRDLALTTNGVLLASRVEALADAGLHRITVSLDTLRADRFAALSQRGRHVDVLNGIRAIRAAGLTGTKIDTVVMRGVNDDELVDLIEFGSSHDAEVRFIEYMDVGGADSWDPKLVISCDEMLRTLGAWYGEIEPIARNDSAPASRFRLPDGRAFGIVASMTRPFCRSCDRARVTADGMWYRCLYAQVGTDLRSPLRAGATDQDLRELISGTWRNRRDQGATDRLSLPQRSPLFSRDLLDQDPHLEMHTRGG